jgi:membrane protein
MHLNGVTMAGLKRALSSTYCDIVENRTLQMAAALSYYLVLSVFPALILFFAVVASLPFPSLYVHIFARIFTFIPAQTAPAVQAVLLDVLGTNHRAWLSLGTIGTIWVASSAFDAMIEALDVAYDVQDPRPFWKARLLALGLATTTGCLLLTGLTIMIGGPRFGAWLAGRMPLSRHFVLIWPVFHWVTAIAVALVATELMYFLAPNVKQRFLATLPGAALAVLCWIGFSYLLGFYFRHIANFSRTYGTLAGFIAFMTWFYWNSFALLVGAELNAELARESVKGSLLQKEESPAPDTVNRAA